MQDVITREIIVKAKKERVFKAITDPTEIIAWFPDAVEEGTLEVGQRPVFSFSGGKHKAQTYIEAVKPFDYFAYRWVPRAPKDLKDVLSVPNTLVEFFIEELTEGTKVTVKESGFSSLPVEAAEIAFPQNSGGWDQMMDRLQKLID